MVDGFSKSFARFTRRIATPDVVKRAMRQMSELVGGPPTAKSFVPPAPFGESFAKPSPGPFRKPSAATPPRQPSSGNVVEVTDFGSNPGALRMLICVPPTVPQAGAPLIVVLHGCGQHAAQFATETGWLSMATRIGAVVVMPEQVGGNNAGRCFNWFRAEDISRDQGEALSIKQMIDTAIAREQADPKRVYIVGLSAGGAMAAAMLAAYPDVFAAGAAVAGLPVGCALDVTAALTRMARPAAETASDLAARARAFGPKEAPSAWPRISIWQGSADHTVAPANAEQLAEQFVALHGIEGAGTERAAQANGTTTRFWRSGAWGVGAAGIKVELHTIPGMAHGYPIAAGAPTDRFVLPVGVDATEGLAAFWGLIS